MPHFHTLDEFDFSHKIVLVRVDLNLPIQDGKVIDITRAERLLPTLEELKMRQAKVVLLSHFGRPKGQYQEEDSLRHIVPTLSKVFGQMVLFVNDCIGPQVKEKVAALQMGQFLLLENLRFHPEEERNDSQFAQALASLGDVYVNDAFSCSHRAHASVVAITQFLPSYAGRGMQAELKALRGIMGNPNRPLMAIVGGSKVSTKLDLLQNLIHKVDKLVVGGSMANTFLSALGHSIGQSLFEADMLDTARQILKGAESCNCAVILPKDVAVTEDIKPLSIHRTVSITDIQAQDKIVDIGETTVAYIREQLTTCATVVWNGPVGIFEIPPFDKGSIAIAKAIAELTHKGVLTSVAGGGDTLAALAHAGCNDTLTYTSTAGGAFLEWLEGKALPGIEALKSD